MRWFAKARKTDPKTSHAAADSVRNITATHERILDILREYGPMNDEQIADICEYQVQKADMPHVSESGLRSRRSELVARGLVVDSGDRVKMRSGRNSIVWKVA